MRTILVLFILVIGAVIGFMLFKPFTPVHEHSDMERGPHHGRLLQKDHFQVEVTIFEPEGVPPKFRIYFYDNGTPIPPVPFQMELKRINRTEKIPFKQKENYLESLVEAKEPHSFKVKIEAKGHIWDYESYEGRVELTPEAVKANGIQIQTAGPEVLEIKLNAMGKIVPDEERTVHLSPRFPGVVKAVYKKLGDHVKKGEALTLIESNESLRDYEVKSEMDGRVIKKDINLGMYLSGQESIFVISDLKTVWADFNIYRQDVPRIKIDDPIVVKSLDGSREQSSAISYISSMGQESTQSVFARAELSNEEERWIPGLFVSGDITLEKMTVPVAIKESALQTFRDWDVVFINVGDLFEVVPVEIGRRDREWVEITSGLNPGDRYASENSFILKADLEKSGAKHEH